MKINSYKELQVWQKGVVLVRETYRIARLLPAGEQFILCSQMVRAAISIPANIAEGWGRNHKIELIRFLNIAYGSSTELETHLIIAKAEYSTIDYSKAEALVTEVQKMLTTFIIKMKNSPTHY